MEQLRRMATKARSTKDLTNLEREKKEYPADPSAYDLLDDCGRGVSATVHRALCKSFNELVAIKRMNLDSLNCTMEEVVREAQTMKNYHHANILPLYCSFVKDQELWMVMPFISGGSVLHIMKYAHPDGLEEQVIATIMRDVLRALEYVHKQGGIHRDVKAGNILIDRDGHVFLGDFGVAANMERSGSWGHDKSARMTFVGTPCWMAPEVMEQSQGYDSSADIWSFGITLLEMAHGHAPFAKFPPMKVLLMTLQNPPPTLDDQGKKHFSRAMRDVVTRCLNKDARLRPSATELLEHKFFRQAKDDDYLLKHIMADLPPLQERVLEIRQGKAATNAQDNDKNFARSQDEYKKGVSNWIFDVAALKAQAAAEDIDDEPTLPTITEADETMEGTLSGLPAKQAAAFVAAQTSTSASQQPSAFRNVDAAFVQQQQPNLGTTSNNAQGQGSVPSPAIVASTPVFTSGPSMSSISSNSAFASFHGQQQILKEASIMNSLPSIQFPTQEPVMSASSDPPNLDLSKQQINLTPANNSGVAPQPPSSTGEASRGPGSTHGGNESVPLSPGTVSPSGLSRESSVQGPLMNLAQTPTANKQKMKQQGRFQIYEPGSEPPPMSPGVTAPTMSVPVPAQGQPLGYPAMSVPANMDQAMLPNLASKSQSGIAQQEMTTRTSEDGIKRGDTRGLEGQESVFDDTIPSEPKKKGRFLVMEAGMSKVASQASLVDAAALSKSKEMSRDYVSASGKPPTAPAAASANVAVQAIMPRLLELLDHAAQQQSALQRIVGALNDAEKGKANPLLSRTQSTRTLLTEGGSIVGGSLAGGIITGGGGGVASRGSTGSGGGVDAASEQNVDATTLDSLRHRVSDLEADNLRLKSRNQQLEAMVAQFQALYAQQQQPSPASTLPSALPSGVVDMASISSASHSAHPGNSPSISPRDGKPGEDDR